MSNPPRIDPAFQGALIRPTLVQPPSRKRFSAAMIVS
jgi:hypothetical protein